MTTGRKKRETFFTSNPKGVCLNFAQQRYICCKYTFLFLFVMMLMLKMIYVTVVEASWSPLGDPLHFYSTTHVELALYLSVHTHALLSIQDSIYFAIKKKFSLAKIYSTLKGFVPLHIGICYFTFFS